jgi:FtsH-binding integral membrane protein
MEKTFNKLFFYYLLILSSAVIFYISNYSFIDNKPTCNNFVINVYLYLAISVCLIGLFAYLINHILFNKTSNYYKPLNIDFIFDTIGTPFYFLSIAFSFIFIILISISSDFDNENIFYNHALWLLFLFVIAITLFPRFKDINSYGFIDDAILITSLIFVTMTGFYYLFSEFFNTFSSSIGMGLIVALIVIIIIELIQLLFGTYSASYMKFMSYIVILLFSLYVSYDTMEVVQKEKLCTSLPNYPKLSIGFFLDVLNIFNRVLFLKSK